MSVLPPVDFGGIRMVVSKQRSKTNPAEPAMKTYTQTNDRAQDDEVAYNQIRFVDGEVSRHTIRRANGTEESVQYADGKFTSYRVSSPPKP